MADWFQENGDEHRAEFVRAQVAMHKYTHVTISHNDARRLANSRDMHDYLQQSFWPLRSMIHYKNAQWGLPQSVCGVEITIADAPDTGFDCIVRFKSHISHDEHRTLKDKAREACGPHVDGQYGDRWWQWFGQYVWGNYNEHTGHGGFKVSRGFVEQVSCPASSWVKNADDAYWHPECDKPCPPTAQPIRRAVVTADDLAVDVTVEQSSVSPDLRKIYGRMAGGGKVWTTSRMSYTERIADMTRIVREQLSARRLFPRTYKGVEFVFAYNPEPMQIDQQIHDAILGTHTT